MKITVTFEIPDREYADAEIYWKTLKAPMNWVKFITNQIKRNIKARNIEVKIK